MTEPADPASPATGSDDDVDRRELAAFYRLDRRRADALADLLERFDRVAHAVTPRATADPTAGIGALEGGDQDLDRYRRPAPVDLPEPDPTIDLGSGAAGAVAHLADPDIAGAFVSQAIGIRADRALALLRFAEAALAVGPPAADEACRWLIAKAVGRLGHPLEAAARLDEAMGRPGAHELAPLVLDAAMLASDRGDLAAALRLAREAGLDERDALVRVLLDTTPTPPPGIGRNDPCYCGSGRKYKQCHLGRVELTLDERATWLHRKAEEWVREHLWRLRLIEVADAYASAEAGDDEVLEIAMDEPFVADLVLTEDGAWADFLADRGPLLPDDERELVERWAATPRSVYEIVGVDPGSNVELLDRRSGPADVDGRDTVVVTDLPFSEQAQPGDLVLAHVLPAGATHCVPGGVIPVAEVGRQPLVDALDAGASALELARVVASVRRGPTITNTEGEPLIFCGATYEVDDPGAARDALDADAALRADRDRPTDGVDEGIDPFDASWVEEVVIDGRDWIRARYTLRGAELVIEANSEVRIARARDRVERSIAGTRLVHEEQRPLDHLADEVPLDPRALLGGTPTITPDLQAVLDQIGLDPTGR